LFDFILKNIDKHLFGYYNGMEETEQVFAGNKQKLMEYM